MVIARRFGQLGLHSLTPIRFLMRFVVLSQIIASAKAFRTAVASERTFLCVCADVPLQVFEPFEYAGTWDEWTCEALPRGIGHRRNGDSFLRRSKD